MINMVEQMQIFKTTSGQTVAAAPSEARAWGWTPMAPQQTTTYLPPSGGPAGSQPTQTVIKSTTYVPATPTPTVQPTTATAKTTVTPAAAPPTITPTTTTTAAPMALSGINPKTGLSYSYEQQQANILTSSKSLGMTGQELLAFASLGGGVISGFGGRTTAVAPSSAYIKEATTWAPLVSTTGEKYSPTGAISATGAMIYTSPTGGTFTRTTEAGGKIMLMPQAPAPSIKPPDVSIPLITTAAATSTEWGGANLPRGTFVKAGGATGTWEPSIKPAEQKALGVVSVETPSGIKSYLQQWVEYDPATGKQILYKQSSAGTGVQATESAILQFPSQTIGGSMTTATTIKPPDIFPTAKAAPPSAIEKIAGERIQTIQSWLAPVTLETEQQYLISKGITPSPLTNIGYAAREMTKGIITAVPSGIVALPQTLGTIERTVGTTIGVVTKTGDISQLWKMPLLQLGVIGGEVVSGVTKYPAYVGGQVIGTLVAGQAVKEGAQAIQKWATKQEVPLYTQGKMTFESAKLKAVVKQMGEDVGEVDIEGRIKGVIGQRGGREFTGQMEFSSLFAKSKATLVEAIGKERAANVMTKPELIAQLREGGLPEGVIQQIVKVQAGAWTAGEGSVTLNIPKIFTQYGKTFTEGEYTYIAPVYGESFGYIPKGTPITPWTPARFEAQVTQYNLGEISGAAGKWKQAEGIIKPVVIESKTGLPRQLQFVAQAGKQYPTGYRWTDIMKGTIDVEYQKPLGYEIQVYLPKEGAPATFAWNIMQEPPAERIITPPKTPMSYTFPTTTGQFQLLEPSKSYGAPIVLPASASGTAASTTWMADLAQAVQSGKGLYSLQKMAPTATAPILSVVDVSEVIKTATSAVAGMAGTEVKLPPITPFTPVRVPTMVWLPQVGYVETKEASLMQLPTIKQPSISDINAQFNRGFISVGMGKVEDIKAMEKFSAEHNIPSSPQMQKLITGFEVAPLKELRPDVGLGYGLRAGEIGLVKMAEKQQLGLNQAQLEQQLDITKELQKTFDIEKQMNLNLQTQQQIQTQLQLQEQMQQQMEKQMTRQEQQQLTLQQTILTPFAITTTIPRIVEPKIPILPMGDDIFKFKGEKLVPKGLPKVRATLGSSDFQPFADWLSVTETEQRQLAKGERVKAHHVLGTPMFKQQFRSSMLSNLRFPTVEMLKPQSLKPRKETKEEKKLREQWSLF